MRFEFELRQEKWEIRKTSCSLLVQAGSFRATLQQLRILALASQGLPNKCIANSLGITLQTTKNHLATLFSNNPNLPSSRTRFTAEAERLGLLYPISIIGLERIKNSPYKPN